MAEFEIDHEPEVALGCATEHGLPLGDDILGLDRVSLEPVLLEAFLEPRVGQVVVRLVSEPALRYDQRYPAGSLALATSAVAPDDQEHP